MLLMEWSFGNARYFWRKLVPLLQSWWFCGFTTRSCMVLMIHRSFFYNYFTTGGRDFFIFGKNERLGNQKGWGRKRNWLLVPFPACPNGTTKCFSFPIAYQFYIVKTDCVSTLKLITIAFTTKHTCIVIISIVISGTWRWSGQTIVGDEYIISIIALVSLNLSNHPKLKV